MPVSRRRDCKKTGRSFGKQRPALLYTAKWCGGKWNHLFIEGQDVAAFLFLCNLAYGKNIPLSSTSPNSSLIAVPNMRMDGDRFI